MRYWIFALLAAFALTSGACATSTPCGTAAMHLSSCLGNAWTASAACSGDDAAFILRQSCASLASASAGPSQAAYRPAPTSRSKGAPPKTCTRSR